MTALTDADQADLASVCDLGQRSPDGYYYCYSHNDFTKSPNGSCDEVTEAVKAVVARHVTAALTGIYRAVVDMHDRGDAEGWSETHLLWATRKLISAACEATAEDVIAGHARYADTAGGRADRETLAHEARENATTDSPPVAAAPDG